MTLKQCFYVPVLVCVLLIAGPALVDASDATLPSDHQAFDVVIYGGTPAGIIAALAVAQKGLTVALLNPEVHLGGMMSGGLGNSDIGNSSAIGGLAREFFERVGTVYGVKVAWAFEPHVAEQVFYNWVKENGVKVFPGQHLVAIKCDSGRIRFIETDQGGYFSGREFIDASYEGDLMAKSGVSYTWGRESRAVYGESLAGVQKPSPFHQFKSPLPAYDDAGNLLQGISSSETAKIGDGDRKIQAYNFRLCLTRNKKNQVPFTKPPGYSPKQYALLLRYLTQDGKNFHINNLMYPGPLPNGKTDVNNAGPFSTDFIGGNWDYPEADFKKRQEIKEAHKQYIQGLLYFLANDPNVPQRLHNSMQQWGLARDEFVDNGNWPYQLYVREARRMIGEYVMTQTDLQDNRTKNDSIGMGSYPADSHHVQRIVTSEGKVLNEGSFSLGVYPYEIPYRSLLPKASEVNNLIVPVCVSASHVAFGSLRMEPQFMIMGHAAGMAAFLAIRDNVPPGQIKVTELQKLLRADGQILSYREFPVNSPPTGTISINGGALKTAAGRVMLTLSASDPDGVSHMQISKDGGKSWQAWEPYAMMREITLSPQGPGVKTVDVRFKDTENAISKAYSASIILDDSADTESRPMAGDTSLSGSILINGGATTTDSPRATLTLEAAAPKGMKISEMQFSKTRGATWYAWEPFTRIRTVTLTPPGPGLKFIDVRFKDEEGRISAAYRASITMH